MRFRASFLLLVALFLPILGHAQATASAKHLSVQLVAPPAQIYPGQSFTAGLYFKLEPGWHVYWVNAGDSGEPPRITGPCPPASPPAPCSSLLPNACRFRRSWTSATRTKFSSPFPSARRRTTSPLARPPRSAATSFGSSAARSAFLAKPRFPLTGQHCRTRQQRP